jgi:beta-1,4-mannosyl-glycoprotein beta-1,4-N-acetylglucosaminyltransferase
LDLLEIRIKELYGSVDKFIIVEGDKTHSGHGKKSVFLENIGRFEAYLEKISHFIAPLPHGNDAWGNERFQRDFVLDALIKIEAHDDDIVIVSDADEIPSRTALEANFGLIKSKSVVGLIQNKYVTSHPN